MNRIFKQFFVIAAVAAVLPAGSTKSVRGAEPAEEFLQALRERGYFDMALEYLDEMQGSTLAAPTFRESVLYEKGVTMIDAARAERDVVLREKQLDQAQSLLEQFVRERATHPRVNSARSKLGNVVVVRAGIRVERAKDAGSAAEKKTFLAEARKMYDEAEKVYIDLLGEIETRAQELPAGDAGRRPADRDAHTTAGRPAAGPLDGSGDHRREGNHGRRKVRGVQDAAVGCRQQIPARL